jgi:uncharacterized protein (DUF1697 family)
MTAFVALLRAVNVGGTGKVPMTALRALCEQAGCTAVTTYIQSGNVVFTSKLAEPKVKAKLERALAAHMGKPVPVLVRSAAEMDECLARNPFHEHPGNRVIVFFLDDAPPRNALSALVAPDGEEAALGRREIYVHYPNGQGRSKLKLPAIALGTGRNMNTVAKLTEMAKGLGSS